MSKEFPYDLEIYKENRTFTGEEACKLILWHWRQEPEGYYSREGKTLEELDYMDIWYYSPTGELSNVFLWWQDAIDYYKKNYIKEKVGE